MTGADLFDHEPDPTEPHRPDPTTTAANPTADHRTKGDEPMPITTTPQLSGGLIRHGMPLALSTEPAPADPSSSWLGTPAGTTSLVLIRPHDAEAAQDVQDAPAELPQAEDTPATVQAAQDVTETPSAPEDAPATRADVARLEGLVLQLLQRDEEQAEAIARLEDLAASVLIDLDTLRQRFDLWQADDEAAAY
ncbi:hypothetical protein [Geodermatophilus chilensis]|uniref:hypothetical protein n=1 Tax=Geodermatophilus chilensis TaxID=2035835 RepID=UPI000C26C124|nr:hypothetical protein [Geodermatophilus chilensis]